MSVKTNIKDFYGRVIGTVVEENNGDKTIKDFYGRVVASGDQLAMLLNSDK